jgi:TM2 domain-containing membrane protein YozV
MVEMNVITTTPNISQPVQSQESTTLFPDPYLYVDKKNRCVYVLLAILLGEIGVHNFYAGYIGRGIAQLLITVFSFGFLFWVAWIWAVVEAIVVKHDGRSIPFD